MSFVNHQFPATRLRGPPDDVWHARCTLAAERMAPSRKGKPIVRWGRKATGQVETPDGRAVEGRARGLRPRRPPCEPPSLRWRSAPSLPAALRLRFQIR